MLLRTLNDAQLTYCTNVHPGETLSEVRALLKRHVAVVKEAVAPPGTRFGVGLRLAAAAADELDSAQQLALFKAELDAAGLYCFTLNGFPYGAFHGTRVKENVYLPDWRDPERVRYTQVLCRLLGELLPLGVAGSISTVPGCFKPNARADNERQMAFAMIDVVAMLVDIARSKGRHIALALEPEPECFLETTGEALRFFEGHLFSREAQRRLVQVADVEPSDAERLLRRHVGVCLDTCHAAVEFESPLEAFRRFQSAGVSVPKVQISAGLKLSHATPERLAALGAFAEGVYLHQTVVNDGATLHRYLDLPQALAASHASSAEWRVHFHVPIFLRELGVFESTQAELLPLLNELASVSDCPHLEVETYTWDVLPEAFRNVPVEEAIARELRFVLETLERAKSTDRA